MIIGIDIDSTLAEWPECEDWHLLEPIDLIPFANCVNVVNGWANDGATIVYITYRSDRWRHGILSITVDWLKSMDFRIQPEFIHHLSAARYL